ncbi:hypothetical protein J4G37_21780 [Microvirga sp. 3-52]|nr:hypothetical protein [Microvirga sp. 3-52]
MTSSNRADARRRASVPARVPGGAARAVIPDRSSTLVPSARRSSVETSSPSPSQRRSLDHLPGRWFSA